MSEILIQLDLLLSLVLVIDGGKERVRRIVLSLFVPALETSEKVRARLAPRIGFRTPCLPGPHSPHSLAKELNDSPPELTQPIRDIKCPATKGKHCLRLGALLKEKWEDMSALGPRLCSRRRHITT